MPKFLAILAVLGLAACAAHATKPPIADERHWRPVNTTWPTEVPGVSK